MSRVADDPLLQRARRLITEARERRQQAAEELELAELEREARKARREALRGIPQPATPDMAGMRQCNGTCGEWKPLDDEYFFRDKDGPSGWSRKCKDCDRAYQRERRARIRNGEHKPKRHAYPENHGRWPKGNKQ